MTPHPQRRPQRRPQRVLFVPLLFLAEPWNGVMEHLRLIFERLDRSEFEPLLVVRAARDGTQTATLAERCRIPTIELPDSVSVPGTRRACREHRVDLVHIHTPATSGVAATALGARLAGVPSMLTLHQYQPHRLGGRARAVNRAAQRLLLRRTLAVSRGVAVSHAGHGGLEAGRIEIVENGIELDGTGTGEHALPLRQAGELRLGYFGRLAEEKGVMNLLAALVQIRTAVPLARTYIVGAGYQETALRARAGELGLGESVVFCGYRKDARALMREMDIVVHAPLFEGFGLSIIEAMAEGRPVVATAAPGGIPELINDGENGLLVPVGDVNALAAALIRLLRDPAEREAIGLRARQHAVRRFDANVMVERIVGMYREILGS